MKMLDRVYDLVLSHLPIGDMCRVAATCHALRDAINKDDVFWSGVHASIGLQPTTRTGKPLTHRALVRRIVASSRCRQCGKSTRGRARAPSGQRLPLCGACTSTGYARLITRREVMQAVDKMREVMQAVDKVPCRPKKRRLPWEVFPRLTVAKMTWHGGHLFWPSELHDTLARIQAETFGK